MSESENDFALKRQELVRLLQTRGIQNQRVLQAMSRVPRHAFCPPNFLNLAYQDEVVPLSDGATLSQPFVVAAMLEAMQLKGGERVLELGSGSGYTTALLCELAGAVYAIEISPTLVASSRRVLREMEYQNFTLMEGNGWHGWLDHFPYSTILVSAAAPSVPPALFDQLSPGGRLVIPVGGNHQKLRVYEADQEGCRMQATDLFSVRFVPLTRPPSDKN